MRSQEAEGCWHNRASVSHPKAAPAQASWPCAVAGPTATYSCERNHEDQGAACLPVMHGNPANSLVCRVTLTATLLQDTCLRLVGQSFLLIVSSSVTCWGRGSSFPRGCNWGSARWRWGDGTASPARHPLRGAWAGPALSSGLCTVLRPFCLRTLRGCLPWWSLHSWPSPASSPARVWA